MSGERKDHPRELAMLAARLVKEKKGLDPLLLEVGKISIVADFFLLVTGTSAVQVHSICHHLQEQMKRRGYTPLRKEGYREAWWVILDYGSLVVHLFQPAARDYYNLERLWSSAPVVAVNE